jgi:hypothetical protein
MALNRLSGGSIVAILALTRVEWRIGWRTAAFRFAAAVAFVFGWSVGGEPGRGVALSAYSTAEAAWQYMGFFAIVWMSLVAVRETTLRTNILVFSKPQPGERLALSKFLGAYLQLLAILLAMFGGSIAHRAVNGGLLGFEAYLIQYVRSSGVLFFAATGSYMLALLFDSALAGCTLGLFWLLTLSGKAFLGKFYFPAYTQNLGAYLALGLALLCATLYFYRRSRRGATPPALWVRVSVPLFVLLSAWQFWHVVQDGHDPDAHVNPVLERMGEQDTGVGRVAAGFLLPDQNGRPLGLSDFSGKILVIALWSPHDPDSILLLERLNDIQAKYGARGVQPIAITICEDTGASSVFAEGESLRYPVVEDWGTFNAPKGSDISPMASAYRTTSLPAVIVTDRRRRVHEILSGIESYDGDRLIRVVEDRLKDEPQ